VRERRRITVQGIVQGVGFRPFVHRLACDLGLGGTVHNFTGGVHIEVEGARESVERFLRRLATENPPISVLESLESRPVEPVGQTDFLIVPSEPAAGPVFVSPDVAICPDCRRELADPSDRRYGHPFINCTNCGPRFTIIRNLPYDRPLTSMAGFPMCEACRAEYEDLTDRRYHAQPVCCPKCGPTLWLSAGNGRRQAEGTEALVAARALLARGGILAVKGLGGFHLACDAASEDAVWELRARKGRWEKPLAVMAPSMAAIERFAVLDEASRELLAGPRAPVVLLPKRLPEQLAPSVAPDSSDYGVMLPYTPLHVLLLGGEEAQAPFTALVMTSGNLSEEPLCTSNQEALERLAGLADAFLLHDREILAGCDDSVVRASGAGPIMMRRSRGYTPLPIRLPVPVPPTLGVGGHLKNTFCLASDVLAYPSQHIGDLDDAATLAYHERSLQRLADLCEIRPEVVACDLHPGYPSTRLAARLAEDKGLPLVRVQHHHAHLAACLADNGLPGPALGLICDGTGYGPDGTVWGCEVLAGDLGAYERVAHLRYVALPGGDKAVAEPWRVAVAWLADCYGLEPGDWPDAGRALVRAVGSQRADGVLTMIQRGVNCPYASSAGRLFDAVAALLGLKLSAAYEAQAAMLLEAAASREDETALSADASYGHDWSEEPACGASDEGRAGRAAAGVCRVLDPRPGLRRIIGDMHAEVPIEHIAARFHATFVAMLADAAGWAAARTGLDTVALSGGTFQNRLVLEGTVGALRALDLRAVWHRGLSPNDSALSVGQVAVAGAAMQRQPAARATAEDRRDG